MTRAIATPPIGAQLAAVEHCIARHREMLGIAAHGRLRGEVFDAIAQRLECLEATAETLRGLAAAVATEQAA
jgi:hypothetical protein